VDDRFAKVDVSFISQVLGRPDALSASFLGRTVHGRAPDSIARIAGLVGRCGDWTCLFPYGTTGTVVHVEMDFMAIATCISATML
jgi:hypothetical protein